MLWNRLYSLQTPSKTNPIPTVKFSEQAKAIWVEWYDKHYQEAPQDNLQPAWSKFPGYCLRLALILSLSRCAMSLTKPTPIITAADIGGAIKLVDYFKSHAIRVYKVSADKSGDDRVARVLRWIRKKSGTVTAAQLQQSKIVEDSTAAKEMLQHLADEGHGTVKVGDRNSLEFRLTDPASKGQPVNKSTGGESPAADGEAQ